MSDNPNFFYREAIYFPAKKGEQSIFPFLRFADIFIDQIDLKLVEEHAEETLDKSLACFFFKS